MRLIDADKFLEYLIFSKHIDSLTCHEVKEAVEMCKIDVLEQIRDEIDQKQYDFMDDKDYDEGIRFGLMLAYQIIDKYRAERSNKE